MNGNDAKKKKLAKLMAEFDGKELAEILSEELDATTRRSIKCAVTADPAKSVLFGKLAAQINTEDVAKISEWIKDKKFGSCSVNGDAPVNMKDGLGGKFDKMSIVFRLSSEKTRKVLTDERKAASDAETKTEANNE